MMKKTGKKTDGTPPHSALVSLVRTSVSSASNPVAPKALPPISYTLLRMHSNDEKQPRDQTERTVLMKKTGKKTDGTPPRSAPFSPVRTSVRSAGSRVAPKAPPLR